MYGSCSDMEHALERFGPATIDTRVEPSGLNALHVAVRRGALGIVKVRVLSWIICVCFPLRHMLSWFLLLLCCRIGFTRQWRQCKSGNDERFNTTSSRLQVQ